MKTTILIVDDDFNNLEILHENLIHDNSEYRILQATQGEMANIIAEKEQPYLVIMDWEMPVMNGIQALEKLKNNPKTAEIPVIMATARTKSEDLQRALDLGAMDYVKKPIDPIELVARVRSAIKLQQAYNALEAEKNKVEQERKKSEELLLNILPKEVAEDLKIDGKATEKYYNLVSVLFTDFSGFTKVAGIMQPKELIYELNYCFAKFDEIIEKYHIEKIKTIGDAYMCAGGVPVSNQSNPVETVLAGLEIQNFMQTHIAEKDGVYWNCRLGINTGEVVAGVIGTKKFAYDLWGDTVNIASRMESNGAIGKVNISENTYQQIKDYFDCEYRGKIDAKGKGKVDMYFVNRLKPEFAEDRNGLIANKKMKQIIREMNQ